MRNSIKILILFIFSILIFTACSEMKSDLPGAPEVNIHGNDVFNPTSDEYHGVQLINSPNKFDDCRGCHAAELNGGITKVSCLNCHPSVNVHQGGIVDPGSSDFHGNFLATNFAWDMRECGTCHGADYSGGIVSPTCLTCHAGTNGPEACNTCHGDFNDPSKIAPPRALNGSTDVSYAGVGGHPSHLYSNELGSSIRCSTCHQFPQSVYAQGHLDSDGKAELIFGRLAVQGGADPSYNFDDNKCSNTYCHGNFVFRRSESSFPGLYTDSVMVGNNFSPVWNQIDGSQKACGTCHGLPPTGHIQVPITECVNCHGSVVDGQGNIIDKDKHINGEKNVFE